MISSRETQNSRWLRGLGVAFVLATCLRVWIGSATLEPRAQAQIPDSGLQRKQILDEARLTNLLLTEIKAILEKGTLNVRMQGADNQAPASARPRTSDK